MLVTHNLSQINPYDLTTDLITPTSMNRVKGIQLTKLSNVLVHRKLQGSALLLAFYVLKLCFHLGRPRFACSEVAIAADEHVRL